MIRIRAFGRALVRLGSCVVALVVEPRPARAEQRPLPFLVEYHPSVGCAPQERFSEQLLARTSRVRRAQPGEVALRYRIHFTGSGDSRVGHFIVSELDGSETARVIPSATCDEMVAAMAVIAAVLVEPNAAGVLPIKPCVITPEKTPRRVEGSVNRPGSHWSFAVGVGAVLAGAVAPDPVLGFSVEAGARLETRRLLSPWFALAWMRTLTARVESPQGTAILEWTALRLTASPMRWPSNGVIALRPGLFFEVGRLKGSGEETIQPDFAQVTWLAFGALLRLEISPIDALTLGLDGGVVVPMQHDSFYFLPNPPLFTIPPLGMTARFGLAAQF